MSRTIEKNDVDISQLFTWSKEAVIKFYNKEKKVFIRLVGDAELNRARVFALRKSSELRKKLKDSNSDEYFAFIPEYDVVTAEELINGIIIVSSKDFTNDAVKEIKVPYPLEPSSDANLEDQEKYQAEVDAYPDKRDAMVREYVNYRISALETECKSLSKDDLYKKYVTLAVNQLCENEMLKRYREMCAYFGTYSDKKMTEKVFSTYEEFDNLPSDVKTQLINEYTLLEIDGEVLKKLPGVTQ